MSNVKLTHNMLNPLKDLIIDNTYTRKRFKEVFGKQLNISNPQTFNEKIQWIKLKYRKKYMTQLADKYAVRKYVSKKIGSQYLNKLIASYSNFENLKKNINKLPLSCVIKLTHGSGWNVILNNRRITRNELTLIKDWIGKNYYFAGREWCYKDIHPQIICERLIPHSNKKIGLLDYKIFCFNGEPKFIQVDINRFSNHTRNIYNCFWGKIPINSYFFKSSNIVIPKPRFLSKILNLSKKLSENIPLVRVDFYCE
ncbi:MAG: hypothetical protein HOC16_00455 [Candidatus Pacebacteria bacterium]|nr:hypothetical protein [Candidatus Paceibacterota bacterium]